MFYDIVLYLSILIFCLGLLYKVHGWFRYSIGFSPEEISPFIRVSAAIKGLLSTIFSAKVLQLGKVFVLDVLLQRKTLREDCLRWSMHILIYSGFTLLLLFHALDGLITEALFSEYYSTINPFMFLRDIFGLMVILGVCIAVYRRLILKPPRLRTNAMDHYAIIIVAVIILSGFFLEGTKISSHTVYKQMVEEFAETDNEEELRPLESLWVSEFGLVSQNMKGPFEEETLGQGRDLHEDNCAACHSNPKWAFGGYSVAKIAGPIALDLDQAQAHVILWYIHFLSCFIGMAYLPFSKMFHILVSPLSMLANSVMDNETSDPANIATRQVMELDACTHCGTCNQRCSMAMAYSQIENPLILPSEKIAFLKEYAADKKIDNHSLKEIQEGVYICTNCDRCTVVCPVGINLKDMWFSVRESLIRQSPMPITLSPLSFTRGLRQQEIDKKDYQEPLNNAMEAIQIKYEGIDKPEKVIPLTPVNKSFKGDINKVSQAGTYAFCFSCENCTTVCPVVANFEDPQTDLDMLPHQIIRSVGLGIKDLALGSKMLWSCITCYQCQENCPQGVKVTDIFYEIKGMASKETMAL